MGTNYYLYEDGLCPTCGRGDEPRHIGKSSGGWCFALHVYPDPENEINTLEDWKARFAKLGAVIKDEYGEVVTPSEMINIIQRTGFKDLGPIDQRKPVPMFYNDWADFFEKNHAVPGPIGLLRSKVDGNHCIAHGEGAWDYIVGEFS